jgi:antitoxin component YwqK of YwqJK toxin-antitoxin module
MKHYRSSIPKAALERVTATFVTGPQKYKVECILNGKVVGIRRFHETGELEYECPLKNGLAHGIEYRSDVPGELLSAEPYSNGLPHGTARQWSKDGKLIGSYTMRHGTGIDLWWCESFENGLPYLSEALYVKDGKRHGFDWWLNEDQKSVWMERHFRSGQMHGIERSWNWQGRLKRGYPRYWVNDVRTTKRQYLRACANDPTLPHFRETDNRPQRRFPSEVIP